MMQEDRSAAFVDVIPVVGKVELRPDDLTFGRWLARIANVRFLDQDERVQAGDREELRSFRRLTDVFSPDVIAVEHPRGTRIEHRFQVSVIWRHSCLPDQETDLYPGKYW